MNMKNDDEFIIMNMKLQIIEWNCKKYSIHTSKN